MFRTPAVQTTTFGDVSLFFYMNQGATPAGPTRGHLMDHYRRQRCRPRRVDREAQSGEHHVPRAALRVGGFRAVMIEGPSKEAIEIVEVKK